MPRISSSVMLSIILFSSLFFAAMAGAEPENLSGGVFIAHHPPTAGYSQGTDWCEAYYGAGWDIASCDEQVNTIDSGTVHLWYVLAAFPLEEKVWCGTAFGFDDITAPMDWLEWGPCLEGHLELHTDGWPGPNEKTAVVATTTPWEGSFVPVYYFVTYASSGGLVPLHIEPTIGFGGFANCLIPTEQFAAQCFGSIGIDQAGIYCCSNYGACCFENGECIQMDAQDCADAGGDYHGGSCDPNPCPIPEPAVCCVGTECLIVPAYECDDLGGDVYPDLESCDPNPCGPAEMDGETWGSIKVRFR